ncbi:MAG: flagellar hook-length control protein FliK [Thiogranum sp.]|nr:flagellar hook-length control protein FliK [Thiogranum sp.]
METSGPSSGIPRLAASPAAAAMPWRVGQILHATVTDVGAGKALLSIGNRQLSAETSLALQKGEQLMLEVRQPGATPVLRLVAAMAEPALAAAMRQLLPRQGALTPLLASLGQLARSPNPPLPALLNQQVRAMVRQIPDMQTLATASGVKLAIARSGAFLEQQMHSAAPKGRRASFDADFKANLLRLVQLVRNWPGSPAQSPAPAAGAAVQASVTASPPPGATPAPAAPSPGARVDAQTGPATPANQPAPGAAASPAHIARAAQAGAIPSQSTGGATVTPGMPAAGPGGINTATTVRAASPAVVLPPPLPGTPPAPQAAVQASLDLLNRLGNLRADLLQQSEAALARLQLHQLAALPREGERGLLEWLLELPVRHGHSIDLWSMRITRDPREQPQGGGASTPLWSVQLAFDLPGLGPLRAQVRLAGERVSTRFWAEQPATLPLLNNHLHELRQALGDAGLEVGDLDCLPGTPVVDEPRRGPPLLSEKA